MTVTQKTLIRYSTLYTITTTQLACHPLSEKKQTSTNTFNIPKMLCNTERLAGETQDKEIV
jgi:hypothetical protein